MRGVICDLRMELFDHLHRMSLRFFTHTKTGELPSRLNNDVIGAQRAVSGALLVKLFGRAAEARPGKGRRIYK